MEYPVSEDILALKKPDEVYLGYLSGGKTKAKEAKRAAIQAYLEVKRIKNKYMLMKSKVLMMNLKWTLMNNTLF